MANSPRIVFFGTPQFAVASLERLVDDGYHITAVVTAPDKPAGRGLQMTLSPVKRYALSTGLKLLQPLSLKDPGFLADLRGSEPELQVVVAFRMMPKEVWGLPRYGSFNLHASLLPAYRGAAPIQWAIIRGETETGVTTFFLEDKMDTGEIIFQEKTPISPSETAGELHDRLMVLGADVVSRTVAAIASGTPPHRAQNSMPEPSPEKRTAPKLSKEDARIYWNINLRDLFNRVRGLSPYPGAFSELTFPDGTGITLKILKAVPEPAVHRNSPGTVLSDGRTYFRVAAPDGYLSLLKVQPADRNVMEVGEFLRGYHRHILENLR
jgi:methionyl-tRNA formyltransferase